MDPCVTCGTAEETTSVCTCDCQCLETARRSGCREIKLIAPTRDTATAWTENDPIVPEGVFFLVKDRLFEGSLEYAIGDGESKYSELSMLYAGAPLSRTGAQNHSPLAASGKSTLDPSWLPAATSSTLGAVMVSTTGAAGKVPIPASGSSTLDSSWLPVSTSGAANKIPIADNNGKLDPSWLPEATSSTLGAVMASTTTAANNVVKADANGGLDGWKDAIIDAITADDGSGGLVTDSNGNLSVDFSQMPTDKFEALLKSLKMLIPLETNLNLYVNKSHASSGDTIIDNRGTQNLPFKTIQAAVNYVTQTYAIGTHTVTIYISSDTYTENVRLPEYSRTTGAITLRSVDYTNPATITNASSSGSVIAVTGSYWYLRNLNLVGVFSDPNNGRRNYSYVVSCSNATVNIGGCALTGTYNGAAPVLYMRMDLASAMGGGAITFSVVEGYHNSFTCNKGNANTAYVIAAENKATVSFAGGNVTDDGIMYDYPCSGVANAFVIASSNSNVSPAGGSLYFPTFSVNGTFTGERYRALNGSGIVSLAGGFPGNGDPDAGTVESTTFSWYKHTAAS